MNNSERAAMAAKIKALLSKTVENGATEEEAMSAVMMAQRLMDKYQITMTETEVKEEGFEKNAIHITGCYQRWFCHGIVNAIAALTNTKALYHGRKTVCFYGYGQDVAFATWVYKSLRDLITKASVDYANANEQLGSNYMVRKAFIFGAAARISSRMYKEVREREATHQKVSDSRALVVVDRKALVAHKINEMFPKLGKAASQSSKGFSLNAYLDGSKKGDQARWDKPLGSSPASSSNRSIGQR